MTYYTIRPSTTILPPSQAQVYTPLQYKTIDFRSDLEYYKHMEECFFYTKRGGSASFQGTGSGVDASTVTPKSHYEVSPSSIYVGCLEEHSSDLTVYSYVCPICDRLDFMTTLWKNDCCSACLLEDNKFFVCDLCECEVLEVPLTRNELLQDYDGYTELSSVQMCHSCYINKG